MVNIRKRYLDAGYLIPIYKKKKGIEMGFNWIFALIAGAFILFMAIFAAGKIVSVGSVTSNTLSAKNFVNILETWEAGIASGAKPGELSFKTNTTLKFNCYNSDVFGRETVSSADAILNKNFSQEGKPVTIGNKYIFTENQLVGKKFYPFSVGYFMPFKVADLIIFSDRTYCFRNTPSDIKENLELLRIENIQFNESQDCGGVIVCFGSGKNCDITVSTAGGYVIKDGKRMYFYGNLIYAAIFSSPEIYECNVIRLSKKFSELALVYADKVSVIERKNCVSNVKEKLNQMIEIANKLDSSEGLKSLAVLSEEVDAMNNDADTGCKLYKNEES